MFVSSTRASLFTLLCAVTPQISNAQSMLPDKLTDRNLYNTRFHCDASAQVQFLTQHGHGPLCGLSLREVNRIVSQQVDWQAKTILVITNGVYRDSGWSKRTDDHFDNKRCAAWGPLRGGGPIKTLLGTWRVTIDGVYVGTYTIEQNSERDTDGTVSYLQTCHIESYSGPSTKTY